MRKYMVLALRFIDIFISPFIFMSAISLKFVRRAGVHRLPLSKLILLKVGVFPLDDHYYEPQFKFDEPIDSSSIRLLTGIDWNIDGQLNFLDSLVFADELKMFPVNNRDGVKFYMDNPAFGWGDAEFWYQIVRKYKPGKIIEIGSGYSTLVAIDAIKKNKLDNGDYSCQHTCIEPYEMSWLESENVNVLRKKVEDVDLEFFKKLEAGDILFIDSSHIIRPNGDVVFEFLKLLPTLNSGVLVHIHDIFSPRNYPIQWIEGEVRFWNEQYLLEAFLTNNSSWEIIGALNYLHKDHRQKFNNISPFCLDHASPGSFYIRKL